MRSPKRHLPALSGHHGSVQDRPSPCALPPQPEGGHRHTAMRTIRGMSFTAPAMAIGHTLDKQSLPNPVDRRCSVVFRSCQYCKAGLPEAFSILLCNDRFSLPVRSVRRALCAALTQAAIVWAASCADAGRQFGIRR